MESDFDNWVDNNIVKKDIKKINIFLNDKSNFDCVDVSMMLIETSFGNVVLKYVIQKGYINYTFKECLKLLKKDIQNRKTMHNFIISNNINKMKPKTENTPKWKKQIEHYLDEDQEEVLDDYLKDYCPEDDYHEDDYHEDEYQEDDYQEDDYPEDDYPNDDYPEDNKSF